MLLLLSSALLISSANTFAPHRPYCNSPAPISFPKGVTFIRRSSSSSNDDVPQPGAQQPISRRKRRVRRKEPKEITTTQIEEEEEEEEEFEEEDKVPVANKADMVQFEIRDVRDVVNPSATASASSAYDDDEDEEFDESDSLKKLLADAKRMRGDVAKDKDSGEEEGSIGDSIKNVISTVVAADFFLICAFLVWFLAGIFCSTVLKDDTVQIAFNGIFQPVVQPALGILMIGGLGSALLKSDDE
eukprot:CAMPEP_0196815044 /NCGR_PEP_ID=MMETSP1362-20130617/47512_1 /TAXON_ID=163516 /ORGANISM="Leptocylindrus danicus, Strain CCMP1856" /LENGTH=243 /DNA_ID=CAMNT_0042191883 /DNA_START=76 /DNA_END=807 /DNA_ORIENTATION=+